MKAIHLNQQHEGHKVFNFNFIYLHGELFIYIYIASFQSASLSNIKTSQTEQVCDDCFALYIKPDLCGCKDASWPDASWHYQT